MNVEYHKWYSQRLNRDMELLVFGHTGVPVLVFPTSYARFYEWKDMNMIDALGDKIDAGHLQLYCIDSLSTESWYNRNAHPDWRMWRHNQWEHYVMHEVYPFMRWKNWNTFTILAGASFGAFLAVNFALKHPDYVNKVVAMSGGYDTDFFGGYYSNDIYFNSPLDYMRNMHDHWILERMRAIDWKLVTSTWDLEDCRETTIALSTALWNKGIWNQKDIWQDAPHDWPSWRRMSRVYL